MQGVWGVLKVSSFPFPSSGDHHTPLYEAC